MYDTFTAYIFETSDFVYKVPSKRVFVFFFFIKSANTCIVDKTECPHRKVCLYNIMQISKLKQISMQQCLRTKNLQNWTNNLQNRMKTHKNVYGLFAFTLKHFIQTRRVLVDVKIRFQIIFFLVSQVQTCSFNVCLPLHNRFWIRRFCWSIVALLIPDAHPGSFIEFKLQIFPFEALYNYYSLIQMN